MQNGLRRIAQLTLVMLLAGAAGAAAAADAGTVRYAGIVSTLDPAHGTFVLRDVGPWHGGQRDATIALRTIVLTPSTTIATARRVWDGRSEFPGDYAEIAGQRSDLMEGEFVAGSASRPARGATR